ncbi:hypothetical protein Taro_029834 [Colocasia esculenta]|uniref:Uncharacterized protein n=1 Tax=Colocasia esculenta TaxID=4460 RepID=A0A843VSB0_COLES|nr:hypothetical protein [Colocasia esculenta]
MPGDRGQLTTTDSQSLTARDSGHPSLSDDRRPVSDVRCPMASCRQLIVIGGQHLTTMATTAEKDPIYAVAWIINSIWRDLLKLENQIPFFILKDLFSIVAPEPNKFNSLKDLACLYLCMVLLKIKTPFPEEVIRHLKSISAEQEVYHLLHLHHKLLKPAAKVTDTTSASKPSHDSPPIRCIFRKKVNQYLLPRMRILTSTKYTADTTSSRINNPSNYSSSVKSKICNRIKQLYLISPEVAQGHNSMIPCIVELGDAGIKFRRQPKASSPLDVAFKDGILHIPPLTIQDNTNSVFRNLTAFEQCCPNTGRYFSIYITFLDCLINTAKDVAILQQCSIIDNMLGSEEEVAQLINQLGKDLTLDLDSRHHYLAQVFAEVNGHCESKWHKYRATCMRDYFSTPWSMLSLLAAIALLFMTLIQVVYAVLSYKKP